MKKTLCGKAPVWERRQEARDRQVETQEVDMKLKSVTKKERESERRGGGAHIHTERERGGGMRAGSILFISRLLHHSDTKKASRPHPCTHCVNSHAL